MPQNDALADEYQTVYAAMPGSKAAPTAGLHFTNELMRNIELNHPVFNIDLKVGLGTFGKLTDDNFASGRLHSEEYSIDHATLQSIEEAEHITAVGTTSVRALESVNKYGLQGSTDIFIQPGYEFERVDSLVTNFHLPSTSLLMLVEAFLGSRDDLELIYTTAIEQKYRFYSFGDAMLIL